MSSNNSDSAFLAFVAGAAFGAVAALLLTPTTGKQVRQKLSEVTEDGLEKLKEVSKEAKFKMAKKTPKEAFEYDGGDCWV